MREMIDRGTGKMNFKNRLISDDKVIVISCYELIEAFVFDN